MILKALLLVILAALAPRIVHGGEVSSVEAFALTTDRAKALVGLTPGTEDYYFYHCLHHQNGGEREKFEKMMKLWTDQLGTTERSQILKRRQALLDYPTNPEGTFETLRNELGLSFNHQREDATAQAQIPSAWRSSTDDRGPRVQAVLQQQGGLDEITNEGLSLLSGRQMTVEHVRQLLNRITRPDYPDLVRLVLMELSNDQSGGFGSLAVHQLLTLDQLEQCARQRRLLGREDQFVRAMLARMRPPDQADVETNDDVRTKYLARLTSFVRGLDPVHNSLKALVLFHGLKAARAKGNYPKDLFLEYLAVPREVSYIADKLRERTELRSQPLADLSTSYESETGLAPIQNDEELVRDYLGTLLLDAKYLGGLETYVNDHYLKTLQAQARILAGDPDTEKYATVLSPQEYQGLRDRVDLEIAPTNPTHLAADDPVRVTVKVKNIKNLIVKAFEINPLNLYRETGLEVDQAIDLDGLVAAREDSVTYDTPPLQSVTRTFDFPWMKGRGIWVVEFVGNGKSSRALIRKGRLHLLEEGSTAGMAFRIVDEKGELVKDGTIWMGRKEYTPDESGRVVLPFAEADGSTTVIIRQGEFASLARILQRSERYSLQTGFYVEREALIEGQRAKLLLRSSLMLAGRPVSLKLLKDVRLSIEATDLDGVSTREDVTPFALEDDKESTHEFFVPERLALLRATVKAKVDGLREGKPIDLEGAAVVTINSNLRSRSTRDWYLRKSGGIYKLLCLGRNGEPVAGRVVTVSLRDRAFSSQTSQYLRTDAQGTVTLGALPGITHITISPTGDEPRHWDTRFDAISYPNRINVTAGEEVTLPILGPLDAVLPLVSLLETIGGRNVRDLTSTVKVEDGRVRIAGLAPGRYDLLLRPTARSITIEVGPGSTVAGHLLLPKEAIQATPSRFPSVTSMTVEGADLVIKVADAADDTRAHVFASWTQSPFSSFSSLAPTGQGEGLRIPLEIPESMYASGRTVGDEYRYVLERRYAPKHPGVMLERPGLVLNPWALRDSASNVQEAQTGESYGSRRQSIAAPSPESPAPSAPPPPDRSDGSPLDYLARPAAVLTNLKATDGVIRIPTADLPPDVRILVTGRHIHLEKSLSLDDPSLPTGDRRLARSLDPALSYAMTKLTTNLVKGKALDIPDRLSTRLRGFGSLKEVYELLATLCSDPRVSEFRFAVDWPTLTAEEKQGKYAEFASHELNFFLHRKDPEFFRTVVRPYIANKHEKTFLDHWLLEDDLTRYLDPWPYSQLNVVEKILLARRTGRLDPVRRLLGDQAALRPGDPSQWNQLFAAALNTGSLGGERGLATSAKQDESSSLRGAGLHRQLMEKSLEGMSLGKTNAAEPSDAPAAPAMAMAPGESGASLDDAKGLAEEEFDGLESSSVDKDQSASARPAAKKSKRESAFGKLAMDMIERKRVRQLYRRADKTKELVETHYYHRPIQEQVASLVVANDFWLEYARAADEAGFLSGRFPLAASNATEVMFVLSVLDLPFKAPPLGTAVAGPGLKIEAASQAIVFHEEVKPTPRATGKARILVSQDFYPADARHRIVDGQEVDNFVTTEFLSGTAYACDVVLTNPGSLPVDLDVLLQVPQGAIPLEGAKLTRSLPMRLEPYNSMKPTFTFYFPTVGDFDHHPVEISQRGEIIARAETFKFHVVDKLTQVDRASWAEISQHGTTEEVLAFLKNKSLERVDLTKIAFRMRERDHFSNIIAVLRERQIFNPVLWSYGLFHKDPQATREYLETTNLPNQVGPSFSSPLLTVNPVERMTYQHFDYDPLIHARAHPLGAKRQILNPQLGEEYQRLLTNLAHKPVLDDRDWLEVAYYLLLQDRIDEGLMAFDRVSREKIDGRIQYDYMNAIAMLLRGNLAEAGKVAAAYAAFPVPRWRGRFQELTSQLAPAAAATPGGSQATRDQAQDRLVSTEPSLDLEIEAKVLRASHRNVPSFTVNYYKMDVELLFSRSPFVQDQTSRFSYVRPTRSETLQTVSDQPVTKHLIPADLHNTNLMVEIVAGGLRASRPYFASSLTVQVIENYGQVQISHLEGIEPAPRLYVKAFARMKDGTVRFYKDGYTDHRQRFDYATLSTDELDQVDRFAILVLGETLGAVVREASPPKR